MSANNLRLLCIFLISTTLITAAPAEKKVIYITPGLWGNLFDPYYESMCQLRHILIEKGYKVEQANSIASLPDMEWLITFDLPFQELHHVQQYPKEKCVAFLWEPPSVVPENYNKQLHKHFSRIYTWDDRLIDNKKYFKFYYPVCFPIINTLVPFTEKKMCTFIFANKWSGHPQELYSERRKLLEYFETLPTHEFDFYGRYWNPKLYKNYKGPINNKIEILQRYKFCICYENVYGIPGYITEKIFDCFRAGCVPIYWGAPNINHYIPEACYIDRRRFANNQELYNFMKNMPEAEYNNYIHSVEQFLTSASAYRYSIPYFIELFVNLIESTSKS
ncbi:MAG: glycosyltransferase family 10 [Candidatus Babeliaceae bacterium]|jgi:hypothetical protein